MVFGCPDSPVYTWTFGDGSNSTQQNPSHTYASPGTYHWVLSAIEGSDVCNRNGTITVQ